MLKIKTVCGELEILRGYYYCRNCGHSEVPLDEKLGLTGMEHKMTKELMLEVAFYGQNQSSYTAASAMVKRAMGIEISKETVRAITEEVGKRVFEADTKKAAHLINHMHEIEMREEDEKRTWSYML